MPAVPLQINDPIELANTLANNQFSTTNPPTSTGFANRQSRIQNERVATEVRNMVRFLVPESGIVEMYVNPQNITYSYKKLITQQRTKGGYTFQYWGEDLTKLRITGTTGTSGVEGINVLYDVYRAEQLAYDPFALALAAKQQEQANENQSVLAQVIGSFGDILQNAQSSGVNTSTSKPTLASYAFGIEIYYSGWVFRGYFEDFVVEESADKLGLFNYAMNFVVTQRRGFRNNFLGWHRSATNGPSDSGSNSIPHSFHGLETGFVGPNTGSVQNQNINSSGISAGIDKTFNPIIRL